MDMIPGKTNSFQVTPQVEGEYLGKCAELCGEYHSSMLFNVKVVSREEYDAHIEELKEKGQEGSLGLEYSRLQDTAPDAGEGRRELMAAVAEHIPGWRRSARRSAAR